MKNIALLGYMSSGKTTIAKMLAQKLHLDAYDLDQMIENEEASSVSKIFETKGELYFRKREHQMLKQTLHTIKSSVLALGGGTPCYAGNMDLLKNNNCTTVYLRASVDNLIQRLLQDSTRPLIQGKTEAELKEFVAIHVFERSYFYNQADITINTDGKSPSEIVTILIQALT